LPEFSDPETGNDLPEVSVVVPVRNEAEHIGECLDSVFANRYPEEKLELLVVDGRSNDGTREIVKDYKKREGPEVNLLDNPKKIVPTAMNIGIEAATGEVILRIDGHSYVAKDFISNSVESLQQHDEVEAVGGPVKPILNENTTDRQRAVALALASPIASGSARFSGKEGYVTTVSFGAYRADVFDRYGDFDERFIRTQDYELNYRIVRSGGRIYMNPKIESHYYPRDSFGGLWSQYFQFGFWKTKVTKKYNELVSRGNLLPPIFYGLLLVLGVVGVFFNPALWLFTAALGGYILTVSCFAALKAREVQRLKLFPEVLIALLAIHLSFALGFIKGLFIDLNGRPTLPWKGLRS